MIEGGKQHSLLRGNASVLPPPSSDDSSSSSLLPVAFCISSSCTTHMPAQGQSGALSSCRGCPSLSVPSDESVLMMKMRYHLMYTVTPAVDMIQIGMNVQSFIRIFSAAMECIQLEYTADLPGNG